MAGSCGRVDDKFTWFTVSSVKLLTTKIESPFARPELTGLLIKGEIEASNLDSPGIIVFINSLRCYSSSSLMIGPDTAGSSISN